MWRFENCLASLRNRSMACPVIGMTPERLQMVDTRTKAQRSRIMKSVATRNTGPELQVRKLLHKLGYRFRLHRKNLPGKPDIVFASRKKVIFVHGCFWHGHGCSKGRPPKSRAEYWLPKISTNQARDIRTTALLTEAGWDVLTVWQCDLKGMEALGLALQAFLGPPGQLRA
ncbi:very short patch repair endonuclease [Tardiphaga sp. 215_C5_N2_1]|uniref:very short patch repair endonuclease n=1 Tax=Tardiphaga sp. 215_C5_N2_1 TaxID=3240774 RepID=UPI003F8B77FA